MAKSKQSKAKAKSAAATTAKEKPLSADEYMKQMLAAGAENGNESDSSGGIAIVGIGPPPPTRKGRVKEFTDHLSLMARRAKDGDCFTIFEVKDKRRKSDSQDRFVQFWFGLKSFYIDLPKTTFVAGEAESLVSSRPGFFLVSANDVAEDQKDYVEQFKPVHRDYEYGDEGIAAEDMAFILFDLWKLPVDVSFDVTAQRAV